LFLFLEYAYSAFIFENIQKCNNRFGFGERISANKKLGFEARKKPPKNVFRTKNARG
jgi:hypothetical protein